MKYLTAQEAAAIYRVEPQTITRYCRQGKFPGAKRMGRKWLIPADLVQ